MCCSAKEIFIDFMVYKRATAFSCPSKPRKITLKLTLTIFPTDTALTWLQQTTPLLLFTKNLNKF